MFIFTDSCTCHPFSAFLPVLAVFRQCFGYFLLEYHISRVPFSVDINTNDVNFAVVSISWIISCSSFPMTFPRLMRAREWWIFTKYVYYFTWPSNNCLQIMVCSCAMSSNFVWLQIIFCSCANETTYASRSFPKQKYRDLSVSRRSIDLLATDKSLYFAQPRSIIANSLFIYPRNTKDLWFSFCSLFQQKPCGNKNEFNWILQGEVDIHNFVFIFYLEKFKVFFVVVARFSVAKDQLDQW